MNASASKSPASESPTSESPEPFLIWEDEDHGTQRWWLTRARETTVQGRFDYFIAEDDVTGMLVGVVLPPQARRYELVAVVPLAAGEQAAVAAAKTAILAWRAKPEDEESRRRVVRWRIARAMRIVLRYLPLALSGLALGALLGLAVALFAVSSGVVGWPIIAVGVFIGASAGPALKLVVDRKPKIAVAGPWTRFAVATISATAGAAASVGSLLSLFWN